MNTINNIKNQHQGIFKPSLFPKAMLGFPNHFNIILSCYHFWKLSMVFYLVFFFRLKMFHYIWKQTNSRNDFVATALLHRRRQPHPGGTEAHLHGPLSGPTHLSSLLAPPPLLPLTLLTLFYHLVHVCASRRHIRIIQRFSQPAVLPLVPTSSAAQ